MNVERKKQTEDTRHLLYNVLQGGLNQEDSLFPDQFTLKIHQKSVAWQNGQTPYQFFHSNQNFQKNYSLEVISHTHWDLKQSDRESRSVHVKLTWKNRACYLLNPILYGARFVACIWQGHPDHSFMYRQDMREIFHQFLLQNFFGDQRMMTVLQVFKSRWSKISFLLFRYRLEAFIMK